MVWEQAVVDGFLDDLYPAQAPRVLAATYIGDDDAYERAIGLVDEASARSRRVDVPALIALSLTVKGELTRVHGDDAAARDIYQESLALARAVGDDEHVSMCLGNLCFIAQHSGVGIGGGHPEPTRNAKARPPTAMATPAAMSRGQDHARERTLRTGSAMLGQMGS